ncbi:unnamed protein product, partial [Prorocentrum cordatum]
SIYRNHLGRGSPPSRAPIHTEYLSKKNLPSHPVSSGRLHDECASPFSLRKRNGETVKRGKGEEEEEEEDGEEWQPSVQHCCGSGRRKMEPCKAPCRQPRVAVSAVQVRRQPAPPDILPPPASKIEDEEEHEGERS